MQLHGHGDTTWHVSALFVTIYFYSLATEQLLGLSFELVGLFSCVESIFGTLRKFLNRRQQFLKERINAGTQLC